MKPLIVLITVFIISFWVIYFFFPDANYKLAGCIAMSVMLLFTGIAHFKYTKGMVLMMPDFMPVKEAWVYFTGITEIAAVVGLLIPQLKITASWLLILFFVLILPANIHSAINHIDYEKGNNEGKESSYLWFRIPLQLFFIGWVYYFGIS